MAAASAPIADRTIAAEIGTVVKHSFIYGLGGVLNKGIAFLMLPVYTHYLSPADYGILEIVDLSMSLLGMFLNMGFTTAFLKYYGGAESDAERRKILTTSFAFVLVSGLAIFGVVVLFIPKLTVLLLGPKVPATYLLLSFIAFVMAYVGNVPYTYVRAREQSTRIVTMDTLGLIALLGLNIYFIVFLKLSILAILISPLIVNVVKLAVFLCWMAPGLGNGIDWKRLGKMLSFGTPLVLSNLAMFTLNFSDRFFLKHFTSLDVVGVYAVSYKVGFMLNFLLIQQFNMMWQARMYIIQRSPDFRQIFNQIFVLYSMVLIFAALALTLFSPEVMSLMVDRRFIAGKDIIPVVVLAYVFLGLGSYLQLGMYLAGKTSLLGTVGVVAAGLTLMLNYILIRSAGMTGAAWSTALGFLALGITSYYFSEKVCPLGLSIFRVAEGLGLAVGTYLLSLKFSVSNLAADFVVKMAFLGAFLALVWVGGILSRDEVATLTSLKDSASRLVSRRLKLAGVVSW